MLDFGLGLKLEECSLFMAGHGNAVLPADAPDDVYRVLCVKSGNVRMFCTESEFVLGKNDIVFLLPGEKAVFEKCSDDYSYDFVAFSVDAKKYNELFFAIMHENNNITTRKFSNDNLEKTVGILIDELELLPSAYSNEMLSLLCSQMIMYMARILDLDVNGTVDSREVNEKICAQVMKYIDSRIFTMKNLKEVAAAMGYNYSYISSLFHKTTGVTLNNYFKNKRMNEAKMLLADSKMSVSEIARTMNYSSVYAFSKAFKEHFGASPGHYSGRIMNK